MLLRVLRTQLQTISPRVPCKLLVGFSGGLDSTVLLHASAAVARELGHTVAAIHINHGLSQNAPAWERHCRDLAVALGIEFHASRVEVATDSGSGLEDAARKARYAAFDQQAADFVLLAHHANDQAETVLFNMLRGCGVLGLAGQPQVRGRYVRPFLNVPADVLHSYAQQHHLQWCTDESNEDRRFSRNYLRHDVIPVLLRRFPAAQKMLVNLALHASTTQTLLDDLGKLDLGSPSDGCFPIDRNRLEGLPYARVANALRVALHAEGLQPPVAKKLDEFVRQLSAAAPDRHPELRTASWTLRVSRGRIELSKP